MATKTAPTSQLRLEWVYGYRGHQCRNNLFYNASKNIIYFAAGIGIVYNDRNHKQRFYLGHDDDILCLNLHPDRSMVATGQTGKSPFICVWDSNTMETVSILKDGHQNGVAAVAFDREGTRLVSVGLDQQSTINVWDWKRGKILATVRGHSDRVFDVQFQPFNNNTIVSCGVKHIKFWTLCGNSLTSKKGVFGKTGEIQTIMCMAFSTSDNVTYSGTMSGDIYIWKGNNLDSVVQEAHKAAIYAIDHADEGFATGGKDGCVRLWDSDFKPITTISLVNTHLGYKGLCVRSVCWRGESVLCGTQDSEIFELSVRERDKPKCLVQGHAEGELWALAIHPRKPIFATGSDDQTLRLWNMNNFEILSRTSLDQKIRSCAFDNEGNHIAVGLMDGSFLVLKAGDFAEVVHIKDRKEVIHEMKFSPCGKFLAVASNDNFVDVYSVEQRYKQVGLCKGSSSFITHIDWSEDSKFLQTNSGAAERLFYKMPVGKQVTNREEIVNIRWHTFTGVLGSEVNGIWEKYTDTNDVNAVDANFPAETIVTGDDFGLVKLFKFPCLRKGAKFRKYIGHSAHVTNVRFSQDKSRVISTGGADHSVFQWRFIGADGADTGDLVDPQSGYMDSNSEASDSDMSDIGEVDSDLEQEKQIKYDRALYKEDAKTIRKKIKSELGSGQKRKKGPDVGLQLEYIHGYRGYDCRNNLFYTQNGEVVYHVAAAGIVYNRDNNTQRFYTEHTDDILCLCIHPLKDLVATGQVGRDPEVHVWDTESLKTVSVLKGQHQRGVCAVDFSGDGKRLASIGLDDNHCIVVWDWRKGEKLATTRGHKDKIFVIKWNPFEPNKLITVGVKHIKFWTQTGGGFTSSRGTFGNVAKLCDMLCITFGKAADLFYSGGSDGCVFVWQDTKLQRTVKAHEGPVFAMHSLDKGFVTGGKDGVVGLWDDQFERCLKTYSLKQASISQTSRGMLITESPSIRAIVLGHGKILVGTRNGEVLEIDKSGPVTLLTQGHMEGELWGLVVHPRKKVCATVSDDKTLRIWDLKDHKMINYKLLKQAGRCVDFSADGKFLAVGLKDGSFMVINSDTMDEILTFHHRKEEISDIKFSPDPVKYLAVASHDNFVDIYNVLNQKRVGTCKGASSYITHVDWERKGKVLMVNSGAKEQLFFEAPRGNRVTLRHAEIEKLDWVTWTSVLGHTCEGVWPPKSDVTDVNAVCVSSDKSVIATADDFGFVKLFQYPVKEKFAKHKKYVGHSAHVTNVRFTCDDNLLVSTGGADTATMVWRYGNPTEAGPVTCGDSDDSDTDSEEEGGYDSDVEREKNLDYASKSYVDPIRERKGVKPHLQDGAGLQKKPGFQRKPPQPPKVKRSEAPSAGSKRKKATQVTDLQLDYVFGYRGFDSRNNLHYINDGADIIFHTAGAGIVQNLSSGHQSFYLEHTDDIICLAVNQNPKFKNVMASGQIGTVPTIHVWDASTKETKSILSGGHSKGVCAVDFSCSGKYLLSVGLEDDHNVIVWRWQEGSKVGTVPGHSQRIFQAEFRPDSDSQFVTVGVKHVKFWTVAGCELRGKRGILTIAGTDHGTTVKMQTMLSLAFGANNMTYTGAMSGDVYVWKDTTLVRLVQKAHSGPVFTMFTTLRDGLIVTGGKEPDSRESGPVKLWDQEMKRCRAFSVQEGNLKPSVVKSVCRTKGKILVGTKDNTVIEVAEKSGTNSVLVGGHAEGEVWGLDVHPTSPCFVTASFDGTVRYWDLSKKATVARLDIGAARSTAFSVDGEMLAVGLKNGEFVVLTTNGLKLWGKRRDRAGAINDVRFSPDGKILAVGSEDCCVDFYDLSKGKSLQRAGYCKGIPTFVIQMDFSADSQYIRVSTGAYIRQVFTVPGGALVEDHNITDKITWASWTSTLGNEVLGIWPKDSSGGDINCSHLSHLGNALATGDDFGFVKLFEFPCPEKQAQHKSFVGHSAHVTNVRFMFDDKFLISTGGDDCSIFVWKCT